MLARTNRLGGIFASAALALGLWPISGSLVLAAPASPAAKPPVAAKPPAGKPAVSPGVKAAAQAKRGLKAGFVLLKRGKAQGASAGFTKLLSNGGMAPDDTARALLGRAQAYMKLKKTAQAIADYSNALWIRNGLGGSDRTAALRGRAQAYRAVGLKAQAQADVTAAGRQPVAAKPTPPSRTAKPSRTPQLRVAAKPRPAPRPTRSGWQPKTAPVAAGWGAVPSTAAAPQPSSGAGFISGLFGNLMSGVSQALTPSAPATPKAPATKRITTGSNPSVKRRVVPAPSRLPTATPRIATAWAKATAVKPTARRAAAKVSAPSGNHDVQLDNLRSKGAAKVLASRIIGQHAVLLASRRAVVDSHVLQNMGTFYRVRIGPFRSASAGGDFCRQLRAKEKRIDCFAIAR